MISSTKYANSVGRIRVMENFMIDDSKMQRMAEAESINEAVRMLVESRYKEFEDYNDMLEHETNALYEYMRLILPDTKVFDAFFIMQDVHNLKVLLKAEFLNKSFDNILMYSGVYKVEDLKNTLIDRDFSKLPDNIAVAVQESIEQFNLSLDPQLIDLILDKAYYEYFSQTLKKTHSSFLKKFTSMKIDLLNIKAFLRVKNTFKNEDLIDKVIISGGSIDAIKFTEFYEKDPIEFDKFIESTQYATIFESGDVEKNCDDYIMLFLRSHRYNPTGIEAVVGYFQGKLTEIKNARIILMGIANNIDKTKTKERLRLCYV